MNQIAPEAHHSQPAVQYLRIGIISHLKHPISEPFAGGLEMHTHLLARSLLGLGHDVTTFASARSDRLIELEAISAETAHQSQDDIGRATDLASLEEHEAYLALMNELRFRDFDIIHNNSLHYLPISMRDALPMPMVTTLHTPPFSELEGAIRLGRSSQDAFVAVSQSVRQVWSPIAHVDQVIPNGIDLSRFSYRAEPDIDPYLVWYGRIVPEKGLHLAMDAAELLSARLKFAGPILNDAYFREEIEPRLSNQTRYVGHLKHVDLARLIGGARAFLCTPRWEEPYGLVVAEALACGVPVAAFARGAIPEILDGRSGVLAVPDDPQSLADAAKLTQTLDRNHCRQRAEAICNVDTMVSSYLQLYNDVLGRAAKRIPQQRQTADAKRFRPNYEADPGMQPVQIPGLA